MGSSFTAWNFKNSCQTKSSPSEVKSYNAVKFCSSSCWTKQKKADETLATGVHFDCMLYIPIIILLEEGGKRRGEKRPTVKNLMQVHLGKAIVCKLAANFLKKTWKRKGKVVPSNIPWTHCCGWQRSRRDMVLRQLCFFGPSAFLGLFKSEIILTCFVHLCKCKQSRKSFYRTREQEYTPKEESWNENDFLLLGFTNPRDSYLKHDSEWYPEVWSCLLGFILDCLPTLAEDIWSV